MPLNISSLGSTKGNCDSSGLGYFVGGSLYAGFFGIPFINTSSGTIRLKSLTLPLAYWSDVGTPRTVKGAVWLKSRNPVESTYNVMDLYEAAADNLHVMRVDCKGSVKTASSKYRYWYSPWRGLGASDRQRVLSAMLYSTNECTPVDGVTYSSTERATEYTFNFDDIEIPSGEHFYVGIYADEGTCSGTSIAIRRLGYTSLDRNGSLDQKYYYDRSTMVAANYVNDYRGRWHFYHDYYDHSARSHNNYAQGVVEAYISVTSIYDTPTISITSTSKTTRNDSSVSIGYSDNGSRNSGNTYVQYSINGSNWINVSGSGSGSGSFSYTPSSYGIGYNASYSVRVRRVSSSTDIDNVSDVSSITMYTYEEMKIQGFKISPANTVNANTSVTLTWNNPALSGESSKSKIEVLNSSGSIVSVIEYNIVDEVTFTTFTPMDYIGVAYDNTNLTLRITRVGSSSGLTTSQSLPFKILYRPTDVVNNINPSIMGLIKENKQVSWSYPSGYKGIVSGYNVTLTSTKGNVVNYNVSNSTCTINTNNLKPVVKYKIGIRAYYLSGSMYYYGNYTEISSYLYFDKGISTPSISYPLNSTWIGNTYRVIFQLPEDYNYSELEPSEQSSYRYKDVEVIINNVPYSILKYPNAFSLYVSNLTHKKNIVFSPTAIGVPPNSTNIISVRVKSWFDTWSANSNTVTVTNMSNVNFNKKSGDTILYDDYRSALQTANNICNAYGLSITNTASKGSIIYANDINLVYNKLLELKNKVNNNYTYDNVNVKFKNFDSITAVYENKIFTDLISGLVSIISHFTS